VKPSKKTFRDLAGEFQSVLDRLSQYDVHWAGTRFDKYRASLEAAAGWTSPRIVNTEQDRQEDRLFWEASSQAQQLIRSADTWEDFEEATIKLKLKEVMDGAALPSSDPAVDDGPRNTLLELMSAAYLRLSGFEVQITDGKEDILAETQGLSFAVECKRPTSENSVEKNLNKLRRQLRERRKAALVPKHGMAIIGIDRIIGLAGSMSQLPSIPALMQTVGDELERWSRVVTSIGQKVGLHTVATLGGVVLTGVVWIESDGCPYTIQQLAAFGLDQSQGTRRVVDLVAPMFTL
jgi:hypothetical protein